ncbi:disease resistance RPP13-like protein 4 [Solanum dulcamara]|uniref:disease resistance RPP13-like protein 4 n=1 Tax=Solanum dulcamara TaxID=45834 RepID=UPI0024867DA7|nr:disease resistance RPP13-like protein 4 [Solanum dulcamara]
MAEAFVSFLIERVEGVLKINKGTILCGAKQYVKDLQTELKKMKLLLKDAEEKQKENKKLCDMIQNIRRVAFKIDDEVENYYFEVAKSRKIWFKGVMAHYKRIYYGRQKKFQLRMVAYKSNVKWYTRKLEFYGVKKIVHGKDYDKRVDGIYRWEETTTTVKIIEGEFKEREKSKFVSMYVFNHENKVLDQSFERI